MIYYIFPSALMMFKLGDRLVDHTPCCLALIGSVRSLNLRMHFTPGM
jgi:hypothetical protein